jgi:hypothetical protein
MHISFARSTSRGSGPLENVSLALQKITTRKYVRNVQVHLLIALHLSVVFLESTATSLDLDTATCLLLNVLDVRSTSSNNLGAQVETRDRLEIDRDALLRPLATSQVIALDLGLFLSRATEATFVDQIREFLLHHLFNFLDSCLQTFLRDAGNVEVKRRVLEEMSACPLIRESRPLTAAVAMRLSG